MTDNCTLAPQHCGRLMTLKREHLTWTGPPGNGDEVTVRNYVCAVCPATLTATIQEPS